MIEVEVTDWSRARDLARPIRFQVFCQEQGIDIAIEQDERDASSLHALARDGAGQVIGTARLLEDGHIGRMAVARSRRRSGVGGAMLKALIERARSMGLQKVVLNAQVHAENFYLAYGFGKVGEVYDEAGYPHQTMQLDLTAAQAATGTEDENLWLEDVEGDAALGWVREHNLRSAAKIEAEPSFSATRDRLLSIYQSKERIAAPTVRSGWVYNFWQDAEHARGIWRRTSLSGYTASNTVWDTLLDLDALCDEEHANWVWGGAQALYPDYCRALLRLSRGGGDAVVVREFDLDALDFVAGGFELPEGKSQVAWIDFDWIFVSADFGAGTLTSSGYPRTVRLWQRGTDLKDAAVVFEGEPDDVLVQGYVTRDWHAGAPVVRRWIRRAVTFQTSRVFLERDGSWVLLDVPEDADIGTYADQLLIYLKKDWPKGGTVYPQGALLACPLEDFIAGAPLLTVLFEPADRKTLSGFSSTRNWLILEQMDNLAIRVERLRLADGHWRRVALSLADDVVTHASPLEGDESDDLWISSSGPAMPSRLDLWSEASQSSTKVHGLPSMFDASGMIAERFDVASKDGTMVPYVVLSRGAGHDAPTLLSGYGGFEISRLPLGYNAGVGAAWLERGGRYVVAGIRGGGEFGPAWHLAAVREKKQQCFDDFIAVARDLVARKLTSRKRLGIQGGSNGGLLVSAVMTQAPQSFGAVVCQAPLIDMRRYHLLLAGASWMAEYGNPDVPEDWDFIGRYSPYQKVRADVDYPQVLFLTSTRDDRVHPGHARKMAARMERLGHPVSYWENTEGGHAGAANLEQTAYLNALAYTFLWQQLTK